MNAQFEARVIDIYKSADPQYPNTTLTLLERETRSTIVLKITPTDVGKIEFDGLYSFDGVILAQKANSAYGAAYLTFKEGVKITSVVVRNKTTS